MCVCVCLYVCAFEALPVLFLPFSRPLLRRFATVSQRARFESAAASMIATNCVLFSRPCRRALCGARMTSESVRALLTSSHERGGAAKKSFPLSTDHLRWRDRSTAALRNRLRPPPARKSPFRSCPRFSQHRPVPPSTPPTERVRPSVGRMLFLGRVPGAVFDRPVTGEHASLSCRRRRRRLPSTAGHRARLP